MTNPNNMPDGNPGNNYNPGDAQPYGNQNQYGNQQGYGAPQGQERVVYVEKAKKSGCLKYGLIALAVLVIFGVIAAAMGGGGDSDSDDGGGDNGFVSGDTAESEEGGVLEVGEVWKNDDGFEIVVNSTSQDTGIMGEPMFCADITYTNNSDEQVDFSGFWDWKVQNPAGAITSSGLEGTLTTGNLAPGGGNVSGTVCSEGAEPGEYMFIYEPSLSFSSDTATWRATL